MSVCCIIEFLDFRGCPILVSALDRKLWGHKWPGYIWASMLALKSGTVHYNNTDTIHDWLGKTFEFVKFTSRNTTDEESEFFKIRAASRA